MKSRILTTTEVQSPHFFASSGEGYTIFSLAIEIEGKQVAGPRQFMIKTADLNEFAQLAVSAALAWKRAKQVENRENA